MAAARLTAQCDDLAREPDDQRADRKRHQQPDEQASRRHHARRRLAGDQLPLEQDLAGGRHRRLGDEHVTRPGGEEVRDVEAGAAPEHAGHALLEQQPLDELGLGLVARPRHSHQRALGELRLDLAGALVALADRPHLARPVPAVDERQLAGRAEPLALVDTTSRRPGRRARQPRAAASTSLTPRPVRRPTPARPRSATSGPRPRRRPARR